MLALLPLLTCEAGCWRCCREPVYVRILPHEVGHIASATGRSAPRLYRKWYHGEDDYRLPTPCEFWRDGCRIYPARPVACKYFPLFRTDEGTVGIYREWCTAGQAALAQLRLWEGR